MWRLTLARGGGVGGVAESSFNQGLAVLPHPRAGWTDGDAAGLGLLRALLRVLDGCMVVAIGSVRPLVDRVTRLPNESGTDESKGQRNGVLLLKPGFEVGLMCYVVYLLYIQIKKYMSAAKCMLCPTEGAIVYFPMPNSHQLHA